MPRNTLLAILLLEGFASSCIQILALRRPIPFVGYSVVTTSIVIAAFLLFLALGYAAGGKRKLSGAESRKILFKLLLVSAAGTAIGLSYPFVQAFFARASILPSLWQLALYCVLIVGPVVFCLAQTIPLLLNTSDDAETKSHATGTLTSLSTVGNVAGCLVTGLIILAWLGTNWAVAISASFLVIASIILIVPGASPRHLLGALTVFILAFVFNFSPTGLLVSNNYSDIKVYGNPNGRTLAINGSLSSTLNADGSSFAYIEKMREVLRSEPGTNKDILVLGAGGFTLTARNNKDLGKVTYVDIDKDLKSIAEEKFLKENIGGRFIAEDARLFLLNNSRQWDVVIIDLFGQGRSIPEHLSSKEFIELTASRVADGGMILANVIANPAMTDTYSRRILQTYQAAIGGCITFPIHGYLHQVDNLLFVCRVSRESFDAYTDNQNNSSIDAYKILQDR